MSIRQVRKARHAERVIDELILPLSNDGQNVDMLLVGVYPSDEPPQR